MTKKKMRSEVVDGPAWIKMAIKLTNDHYAEVRKALGPELAKWEGAGKKKQRSTAWERKGPVSRSIRVELLEPFDARGMRPVYWRTEYFGRTHLHMNVWLSSTGRVLARFWSRSSEPDWESYEVLGFSEKLRPKHISRIEGNEDWVPERLRDEFDNWVICMMPFVY